MKLFFPNGEHATVDLTDGVVVIGSSPTCQIVLNVAGVVPRHCEIRTEDGRSVVSSLAMSAPTTLNGAPISGFSTLKGGDLLTFAGVACRVVSMERKAAPVDAGAPRPAASVPLPKPAPAASAEDGRTRVRMALPKFVLRGVSGATFGKVFHLHGMMSVGRGSDCDIQIPSEEVSRHHARLQLVPEGVMVEDTGSANGTYVNDQRVVGPTLLKPGGELRMDVVRFLLIAPGAEPQNQAAVAAARSAPATAAKKSTATLIWVGVGIAILAAIAVYALKYGFRF